MSIENKVAIDIASVGAPTFGPAIVSLFGLNVPILAMTISLLALFMMRMIATNQDKRLGMKSQLTKAEDIALTVLLAIILFAAVTGEITGEPLGVGMSVVWAIGLGSSGLLVVEIFATRIRALLNAWLGGRDAE